MDIKVGDMVYYERSPGVKRYCVVTKIQDGAVWGIWENDIKDAQRESSGHPSYATYTNLSRVKLVTSKPLTFSKPGYKKLIELQNALA